MAGVFELGELMTAFGLNGFELSFVSCNRKDLTSPGTGAVPRLCRSQSL